MTEHIVISLAGIGLLAIACQWLAWWVKIPAILFLLLGGILIGPVGGWLKPDALFGDLLLPLISLSVAVILFEGSLTLRFHEIRGVEAVVRRLVSTGLIVTWLVTAAATHWILDLPWFMAFLFGAVTVVTGPTVIVPLLRTVRPSAHVASILRWEGIVIDPVGALLAVLVFEFIISGAGGAAWGHTVATFASTVAGGALIGAVGGWLLGSVLRRHWLPEYLHNVATLTWVFAVFAAANHFQGESGLLAVTVMGVWLANMKRVSVENILDFKESLSVLLISGLFILLAARVDFAQIHELGWAALGVLAVMQFVARPLKVMVATWGSSLTWRERALLAWIGPRGIVAAAVAAVFAIRLQEQGEATASLLVPLTFMVIIGTVVLQSATARGVAKLLGVAEPEPRGFLVVGANPLARAVATALRKHGIATLLAEGSWDQVRAALMEGLDTYYGNPVSEHADRRLDLVGLGRLLALSPRHETNALAALRYRAEFGVNHVYTLLTGDEGEGRARAAAPPLGHIAFGADVNYMVLSTMLSEGARIRETKLSENFDFHDYYKKHYRRAVPLFAVDPRKRLHVFTADISLEPGPGWAVIALVQERAAAPQPEQPVELPAKESSNEEAGDTRATD